MKNYLVTGAAGFIGSKVAQNLLDAGNKVYVIDNLSTGFKEIVPHGAEFIEGDCADPAIIKRLEGIQFECIYHIAGQSSGEVSFENPVYDLQTNAQSTLLLLEYCRKFGVKNFVYASTMSVYGNQEVLPVSEKAIPIPESFYGVGKLASEHYLRIFSKFGINCTAIRLFNVYGPGQNLSNMKQGMVSIFLAQAIQDGKIVVKGDKNRFRDFVYIDDVVDAFIRAEKLENGFHLFNICNGGKLHVYEIVDYIIESLGKPVEVEYISGTPGDQFGIFGSNEEALKEINWQPKIHFKVGFTQMVNWALKQLSKN